MFQPCGFVWFNLRACCGGRKSIRWYIFWFTRHNPAIQTYDLGMLYFCLNQKRKKWKWNKIKLVLKQIHRSKLWKQNFSTYWHCLSSKQKASLQFLSPKSQRSPQGHSTWDRLGDLEPLRYFLDDGKEFSMKLLDLNIVNTKPIQLHNGGFVHYLSNLHQNFWYLKR